jgi:hypothetical protein
LRRLRSGVSGEVGRRSDCGHSQWSDAHGYHVFFDLLAQTDARVIALRHYVGQAKVNDGLDMDIGIVESELPQRGHQDGLGRVAGCRDANRTGGFVAQLHDGGECRFDLIEVWPERPKQTLSGVGRGYTSCCAR